MKCIKHPRARKIKQEECAEVIAAIIHIMVEQKRICYLNEIVHICCGNRFESVCSVQIDERKYLIVIVLWIFQLKETALGNYMDMGLPRTVWSLRFQQNMICIL